MTDRTVPSRTQWMPAALPLVFGVEPPVSDPWPGLRDAVVKTAVCAREVREAAVHDLAGLPGLSETLPPTSTGQRPFSYVAADDGEAPMRVVLMGRTMAGKSSLLAVLTGSHFDRIGDGRQRFSRDVFPAVATASNRIEVVDTPGVGAHGGVDDTATALEAAVDADVVLWVNSSDSIQEESAAALRLLGVIGKPIIVVINCRQALEGVGRLNLLRYPDRVFGDTEGLVDEIRRHMAKAGIEPLDVVQVHALAAAQALSVVEGDPELLAASRVDDLTEALVREHATHSVGRLALRLVDGARHGAEVLAESLIQGAASLRAQAAHDRGLTRDAHARLDRLVRITEETMAADVDAAVGRRRDWHLTVTDFGESLQNDWNREIAALQGELDKTLEDRLSRLRDEVRKTVEHTDAEWASVSSDPFDLDAMTGFDSVWGNRLGRAAVGLGTLLGAAKIGAIVGAAVGGPPGAGVGAVVGLLAGGVAAYALSPLKNLVDHIFLGKAGVLAKRRGEAAEKVGPILDKLVKEYLEGIAGSMDELRRRLMIQRLKSALHAALLDRTAFTLRDRAETIHGVVRALDRETSTALLRIAGRERLARSVKRATRVPGVCVLAEFDDAGFWESWLYPPDIGEKLAGGKAPLPAGEAAVALSYALSLVEAPVRLARATSEDAHLNIDADVPTAITETWAQALSAHLRKRIQITPTTRSSRV